MDLVLFDLDNTLLAGDSDFEWAQYLISRGVLDREVYEARNLDFYEQYKAGTLDIHEFLDFQLKEPVSIEARVRTCRAAGAKVIVLSSLDSPEVRERAMKAGVADFLSKTLPMRDVMDAARKVMGIDPRHSLLRDWRPLPAGAVAQSRPKLSAGETEALSLYASGLSTNQVAEEMGVQYETAKTYLRRVREKYAKVNRPASKKAELIRRAAEDGYLS